MNSLSILPVILVATATTVDSINLRDGITDAHLCQEVAIEIQIAVAEGYLRPDFGQEVIDDCWSSIER